MRENFRFFREAAYFSILEASKLRVIRLAKFEVKLISIREKNDFFCYFIYFFRFCTKMTLNMYLSNLPLWINPHSET